mmetsp:Transcript_26380/g.49301  ORF Transcript_26380/g.49301 Transcript_26380/m.49301 type:complete len:162 (+) Transcript_26380:1293-1778(+)
MIEPFCKDVKKFLGQKPNGVAAIHCKAGKGRTGFLISCYLIYTNPWFTVDRALRFFAVKRTKNQKGVTIPSQRRYVGYFDRMLRDRARENQDSLLELEKKSSDLAEGTTSVLRHRDYLENNVLEIWADFHNLHVCKNEKENRVLWIHGPGFLPYQAREVLS